METLIESVRAYPCLWNPLHPDYREMQVREDAWQRIVKRCSNNTIPDVETARTEWKKLRVNHREALKRAKLGQNKLLPAQITTWKYAKAMQFLEPHMKYRITENIEVDPPESTVNNFGFDMSMTEVANSSLRDYSNKRHCTEYVPEKTSNMRCEKDALDSFFNCMLMSTREMPLWMQTKVKKKIFAVIIDAEEFLSTQQVNQNDTKDFSPVIKKIKTELI